MGSSDIPPGFGSLFSRGAAVATGPSSPRMSFRMRSPALSPQSGPSSPRMPFRMRSATLSPQPGPSSPRMSYRMRSAALSPHRKPKLRSEVLVQLDQLKQAAIAKEDFLLANSLKEKMDKLNELEIKKAAAVRTEDFLLAMDIKKQINELTVSTLTCQETKQECEDLNNFSLFENPLQQYTHPYQTK